MKNRFYKIKNKESDENNTPMVEIFGGTFAFLMILMLLLNIISKDAQEMRLETKPDEGEYKISWENKAAGFIIITFPTEIKLIEENRYIKKDKICAPQSPFIQYALKIYKKKNQQIIFAITNGSVETLSIARNCLREIMPNQLLTMGWIVANQEFLKAVALGDIPAYIDDVIKK